VIAQSVAPILRHFKQLFASWRAKELSTKNGLIEGVHSDFVHRFVNRRKIVPASFASALPNLIRLRHTEDYRQPGVSQRHSERAVRLAREFVNLLITEVWHAQETPQ
jgi:hypothetical protein